MGEIMGVQVEERRMGEGGRDEGKAGRARWRLSGEDSVEGRGSGPGAGGGGHGGAGSGKPCGNSAQHSTAMIAVTQQLKNLKAM